MPLFTNQDSQSGQPKYISVGQIRGLTISGVMSGYVENASLTISAPPAGGVQAVAYIQVTAGAITGATFTNVGSGYTSPPTISAPTGTGAVLSVTIAANKVPNSQIVFVSYEESQLQVNRLKGIKIPGWYRIREKAKNDGQVTYKLEVLAALTVMTAVSGDARNDNLVVGNVEIIITSQPTSVSVVGSAASAFTVSGTGISTYQWRLLASNTTSYVDVTNGGVYSGSTTGTLSISASTGLNGNRYRCVCGNGGTAQVNSFGATLTVS